MGYSSRLITLSQLAEPFTEIKSHEKVGLMAEVNLYSIVLDIKLNKIYA